MPRFTEGSCLGSNAEMRPAVKTLPRQCAAQAWDMCPSVYESQAGHQSPELFEVLWSCKWRSVPLLSGTFLFAMVRPPLHHSRFFHPVPQGPGMDRSCVFISPLLVQNREGGGWMTLVTALVIPTWQRCLTWVTGKPQGPFDIQNLPETLM